MQTTGYSSGVNSATLPTVDSAGYDVTRLRRQYEDYFASKRAEIEEQKNSRRYYHGSHWTAKEIEVLKKRGQPPATYNRVARKIDAVIGWIERLRQEPKAYPRTPMHEQGSEVATAVLRYVLDHNEWKAKSPIVARNGATDGIGGIEFNLVQSADGDPDVEMHIVDPDTFFYDPRSYRDGFSDARFMGVSKWMDIDEAKDLVPDKADEIDELAETGGADFTDQNERAVAWINTREKKIRLVDHWYLEKGKWYWCLHVGQVELKRGESPFIDERKRSFPKYRMFSGFVDQDGDRYGFVRNLKSAQDEINHRLSKALHMAHSRRLIMERGAVENIETVRKEWARPDGIVEVNPGFKIEPEDQSKDIMAQFEFMKAAKDEIENFGPNPAMVGQGLEDSSGRAIALLQQAGIAELGPYLLAYKSWKMRVYRDIWNIVQGHWTAERWIRVTDDQEVAQFFQINKLTLGPNGLPAISNALGELDVDIILDEGPDTINMQADAFGVLQSLGPQFMQEFPEVALSLAPLQGSVKKSMLDKIKQIQSQPPKPDPKIMAMQAQMQMQAQMEQQSAQIEQQKMQFQSQLELRRMQMEAQQADQDAQRKQQEFALDVQARQQDADRQLHIEATKAQLERDKAEAMITLKVREQDMDFHHEQRKMDIGVQSERNKMDAQAEGERKVQEARTAPPEAISSITRALEGLTEQITKTSQDVAMMQEHMSAPTEIIRGKDGRPTGVKRGKKTQMIVRGPDGRAAGLR